MRLGQGAGQKHGTEIGVVMQYLFIINHAPTAKKIPENQRKVM